MSGIEQDEAGQRQDGIEITEAAIRLGMTPESVRKRLLRGRLKGYKASDGTWRVILVEQDRAGQDRKEPQDRAGQEQDGRQGKAGQDQSALVAALQARIDSLESQLRAKDEQIKAALVIAQQAQQQVAQLTDQRQPEPPSRRPWWRLWRP